MAEEPNNGATEPGTPPAAPEADPQPAEAAKPELDWEVVSQYLDQVPADQIRKHKRFAGIVGSATQQAKETWERERKQEEQRQAAQRAEEELLNMARETPIEFAEKFLSDKEADRIRQQIANVRADTAKTYMNQIGLTFGQQFKLTQDEIEEISTALQGKNDDEVLPAFNVAATKVITEREAKKLFDEWRTKELPKERDALKQEVAAEMLKGDPSPSIRRGNPPVPVKPHLLPDADFDKWYERNVLRRKRY